MTIIRRDVKIVYDDPPAGVIATPAGSGLVALGSSSPLIQRSNAFWPNEPLGNTRFFEYDFTVPILHGIENSNGQEIAGCIWKFFGGITNPLSDPTAPHSGPDICRFRYAQGFTTDGASPGLWEMWDCPAAETSGTEFSQIYESAWIKVVSPNNIYEDHQVGTKIFGYWGVGSNNQADRPTAIYLLTNGGNWGTTNFKSVLSYQFNQQAPSVPAGRVLNRNVDNSTPWNVGQWYQYELVMGLNDVGVANGTLEFWMNGVKTMHHTDVVHRTPSSPSGFWGRHMNPVYGGAGPAGTSKTQTDDVYWDHVRISGVPI